VPNDNPSGAGAFDFPLRFPGQYFDRETNLAYNYFRDYDPSTGRYIQSDPIGLRAGLNTYGYGAQDPVRRIDPLGLLVSGRWIEYPHPEGIDVDVRFREERDRMPDIQLKWGFIPYWVFLYADITASANVKGRIECTDDCPDRRWELAFDRKVRGPTVSAKLGYTLVPVPFKYQALIAVAINAAEYGEAIYNARVSIALEIAKLAANPTLYCIGFPQ